MKRKLIIEKLAEYYSNGTTQALHIANLCDDHLDTRGKLLGEVRAVARGYIKAGKITVGSEVACVKRKRLKGDDQNCAKVELKVGETYVVENINDNYSSEHGQQAFGLRGLYYEHLSTNFELK